MESLNRYLKLFAIFICPLLLGAAIGWYGYFQSHRQQLFFGFQALRFSQGPRPILWEGYTQKKLVALTIDDGPDPRFTPRVLDILKKEKVHATFFVVGKSAQKWPGLVRRAVRQGNLIENHSWDHPEFELLTAKKMRWELNKAGKEIKTLSGKKPIFFRPPRGILTPKLYKAVVSQGYYIVLWTNSVRDRSFTNPSLGARKVSNLAGDGTIILMHDGIMNHKKDVQALPFLIKDLKKRGFKFVRLDELLQKNSKRV